ncbi:MAG: 16S rRNA (cytosine(1402)-N(4))-methyltransferase [Anaerolineae bacterium]|nr:16S rRNA (cytosine(1402)-N(4))-methyltransferase RsmH [Anaerolineales bacterium]MCQ3976362.1 16S rRNA (cytosine(1402)-N(4))-methyltransferase [Anaerolineae bacterium]
MHQSVLLAEVIAALQPYSGGVYIDGTVGAGGHTAALLAASAPDGQVFGFDRDQSALELARRQLAQFGQRVHLFHANFDRLAEIAQAQGLPKAEGILLDLGVSSMQFDQPERGFSFQAEGPLDMRMDASAGPTAADLVNSLPEEELANLIYQYGEERHSRRIARAIVRARPIHSTAELAQLVVRASGASRSERTKIHPATRTFQALRIAVNDELGALERTLPQALECLKPGGRLAVISFHSLEDRIVKNYFKQESQDCICPPEQPVCTCRHKATIDIITKKPITASLVEIDANPRARSAKLRVVELKRV